MVATSLSQSKVLVVDDDSDLRELLHAWLSGFVGELHLASGGHDALSLVKRHAFDVVITDLRMPGITGLQLLPLLRTLDPAPEVIFLTGHGTKADAIAALREGRAFDFLLKPLTDLYELNRTLEKALVHRSGVSNSRKPSRHLEALSPREREILTLLAKGLSNREIADRLILSEKTIQNHLTRIYEKLKASNRTQATHICREYGLI